MEWIFLVILVVSVVHVIEEYLGDFVGQMKQNIPEIFADAVDLSQFVSVNLTFLILCIIAVIVGSSNLVYSLSIATILFINVFAHIGGTIRLRSYNAGLISALVLYLPISIYAYYYYWNNGSLSQFNLFLSIVLGIFWMIILFINMYIQSSIKRVEL